MGRCMNSFILAVVLLAGIGIIAALALGAYFALQPKPETGKKSYEDTELRIPADAQRKIGSASAGGAGYQIPLPTKNQTSSSKNPNPVLNIQNPAAAGTTGGNRNPTPNISPSIRTPTTNQAVHAGTFEPVVYAESDHPAAVNRQPGKGQQPKPASVESSPRQPAPVASTVKKTTITETVKTTSTQTEAPEITEQTKKPSGEFARLVLPENTENFVSGPDDIQPRKPVISFPQTPIAGRRPPVVNRTIELGNTPDIAPPSNPQALPNPRPKPQPRPQPQPQPQPTPAATRPTRPPPIALNPRIRVDTTSRNSAKNSEDTALEKHLLGYQKIAGISYRNGYLYVPSYVNGRVSVLSTPDMNTLIEYACAECSIYDIAALSTGDMVAALGRSQELVKIDPLGNEIRRLGLNYATKGLDINGYNEVFVLSRSHKEVYVYNKDLEQVAQVKIPGKKAGDCNFLSVNDSDVLFVSCQEGVYVFTVNGDPLMTILPPKGVSYGVGMDIDSNGNILVVRRGQGILDIYDKDGNYVEAVGEGLDTLWSDIAVGEEHLYVVDYIDAKIKVFRYN